LLDHLPYQPRFQVLPRPVSSKFSFNAVDIARDQSFEFDVTILRFGEP
jgi:hypothetical protein